MDRRGFLGTIGFTILIVPLATEAQQLKSPARIGFLPVGSPSDPVTQVLIDAFRQGLREAGRVENRDFVLDIVWISREAEASQAASALIRRGVSLLIPVGSTMAVAAKRQTSTIPILFLNVGNPVTLGLVESLSHPNSNATGFSDILGDLSGKHVDFAKEIHAIVGRWPDGEPRYLATERAARSLGVTLRSRGIGDADEISYATAAIRKAGAMTLIIQPSRFTWRYKHRLIESAMNQGLGTIFGWVVVARDGALIGYGPDGADLYRRAASYADRILNGANPADLPVQEPTKFVLAVNLKTAKALGLTIPPSLLLRADHVIE